jgi:hypothetical protein
MPHLLRRSFDPACRSLYPMSHSLDSIDDWRNSLNALHTSPSRSRDSLSHGQHSLNDVRNWMSQCMQQDEPFPALAKSRRQCDLACSARINQSVRPTLHIRDPMNHPRIRTTRNSNSICPGIVSICRSFDSMSHASHVVTANVRVQTHACRSQFGNLAFEYSTHGSVSRYRHVVDRFSPTGRVNALSRLMLIVR